MDGTFLLIPSVGIEGDFDGKKVKFENNAWKVDGIPIERTGLACYTFWFEKARKEFLSTLMPLDETPTSPDGTGCGHPKIPDWASGY